MVQEYLDDSDEPECTVDLPRVNLAFIQCSRLSKPDEKTGSGQFTPSVIPLDFQRVKISGELIYVNCRDAGKFDPGHAFQ